MRRFAYISKVHSHCVSTYASWRFLPKHESHWNKIHLNVHINVVNPKTSLESPVVEMLAPWFVQPGWLAFTFLWRRSPWPAPLRSTSWNWSWRSWTSNWARRTAAGSSGISNVSHTATKLRQQKLGSSHNPPTLWTRCFIGRRSLFKGSSREIFSPAKSEKIKLWYYAKSA